MTEDARTGDVASERARQSLAAAVVTHEAAPDECTLSPRDPSDDRTTTAWMTASGDAFVSLDAMR